MRRKILRIYCLRISSVVKLLPVILAVRTEESLEASSLYTLLIIPISENDNVQNRQKKFPGLHSKNLKRMTKELISLLILNVKILNAC